MSVFDEAGPGHVEWGMGRGKRALGFRGPVHLEYEGSRNVSQNRAEPVILIRSNEMEGTELDSEDCGRQGRAGQGRAGLLGGDKNVRGERASRHSRPSPIKGGSSPSQAPLKVPLKHAPALLKHCSSTARALLELTK